MKKVLGILLNRDMLLLIIVNLLLADTAIFSFFLLAKGSILGNFTDLGYALIIMIIRLFVLPIFYNLLKNHTKDKYIQKFLYKLKYSAKTKLLILILSPIPFIIEFLAIFGSVKSGLELLAGIGTLYLYSLFCGLFGSYLVLFIYWYIEDKIKKVKKQSADKA